MTAREVVEAFHDASPCHFGDDVLVAWISEIEGVIYEEVICTHEGWETVYYYPMTLAFGYDDRLLAPEPFSKLYLEYLFLKSDLAYGDRERYDAASEVFSETYHDFADWYNRTHKPRQRAKRLITRRGYYE